MAILFGQNIVLDPNFNVQNGFSFSGAGLATHSLLIQPDNKILVGGQFSHYNNINRNRLLRIFSDGIGEGTSFITGLGFNNIVRDIGLQSNGNIIAVGDFSSFNSTNRNRIACLFANGSLNTQFNYQVGANSSIWTVSIDNLNRVVIGGTFGSYDNASRSRITRLLSNGLQEANVFGSGFNDVVYTIKHDNENKILVGGAFTIYNTFFAGRIVRLQSNGSLDTTFTSGSGFNGPVYAIATTNDNKIYVGGDFSTYNGTSIHKIARLNNDGTLDASFNPGNIAANGSIRALAIHSDGKVVLGGEFTTFNGVPFNRIVRLNTDGSIDTNFNIGSGFNDTVLSLQVDVDNRILAAGHFATFNGLSSSRIARLVDTSLSVDTMDSTKLSYYPNPTQSHLTVQSNDNINQIAIFDLMGRKLLEKHVNDSSITLNVEHFSTGEYLAKIQTEKAYQTIKILKQ